MVSLSFRLSFVIFLCAAALAYQSAPAQAQTTSDPADISIYGGLAWSADDSLIAVGTDDGLWLHDSDISAYTLQTQCLGTFKEFAYTRYLSGPEPVFPLPPWEEIIVPSLSGIADGERLRDLVPQISRVWNGELEIWFLGFSEISVANGFLGFALRYRPGTGTWDEFSNTIENTDVGIGSLLLGDDGTIWGAPGYIRFQRTDDGASLLESMEIPSYLVRFDEENQRFVTAGDEDLPEQTKEMSYAFHFAVIQDNFIWQFVEDHGVYRYDTDTETIIQVIDLTDLRVRNPFLGTDGYLYYIEMLISEAGGMDEMNLIRIDPINLTHEAIFDPWDDFGNTFGMEFDGQGRLWLAAAGYLDPDGTPVRTAPFRFSGFADFPRLSFSSSDGQLWYIGTPDFLPYGAAWLNPETGESCVFTNQSPLGDPDFSQGFVEDINRGLWFNIGARIFRLSLDEYDGYRPERLNN